MAIGAGAGSAGMFPLGVAAQREMEELNYQKLLEQAMCKEWIKWYLSLEDHDLLIEVERDFMLDKMNLL